MPFDSFDGGTHLVDARLGLGTESLDGGGVFADAGIVGGLELDAERFRIEMIFVTKIGQFGLVRGPQSGEFGFEGGRVAIGFGDFGDLGDERLDLREILFLYQSAGGLELILGPWRCLFSAFMVWIRPSGQPGQRMRVKVSSSSSSQAFLARLSFSGVVPSSLASAIVPEDCVLTTALPIMPRS